MPRQQRGNNSRGRLVLSDRRCGPLITDPGANWLSKATPGLLDFVGGSGPVTPLPEIAWSATITAANEVTVTWTPTGPPDVVLSLGAFEVFNLPENPTSGVFTPGQAVLTFASAISSGWQFRYLPQALANNGGTQSTLAATTQVLP